MIFRPITREAFITLWILQVIWEVFSAPSTSSAPSLISSSQVVNSSNNYYNTTSKFKVTERCRILSKKIESVTSKKPNRLQNGRTIDPNGISRRFLARFCNISAFRLYIDGWGSDVCINWIAKYGGRCSCPSMWGLYFGPRACSSLWLKCFWRQSIDRFSRCRTTRETCIWAEWIQSMTLLSTL